MKYSEIVVLFMVSLHETNGGLVGKSTSLANLTQTLSETDDSITERLVEKAIGELLDHKLISVKAMKTFGRGKKEIVYADLDLTGTGLRFIEALEVHAKAEGKKQPWLWSMVEKAGTLANLVHVVVQMARGG